MSDVVFENQFHEFQRTQRTEDPTGAVIEGDRKLNTLGGKARRSEGLGGLGMGPDGLPKLTKLKESKSPSVPSNYCVPASDGFCGFFLRKASFRWELSIPIFFLTTSCFRL